MSNKGDDGDENSDRSKRSKCAKAVFNVSEFEVKAVEEKEEQIARGSLWAG
jgi:hypothetical protein